MEIEFDNSKVQALFTDYNKMQKKVGLELTKKIKQRIDQVKAFDNFFDVLNYGLGNPHLLEGNKKGLCAIIIDKNKRLIIKPIVDNLSAESLKVCRKIIIKGVEDYHGSKTTTYIP